MCAEKDSEARRLVCEAVRQGATRPSVLLSASVEAGADPLDIRAAMHGLVDEIVLALTPHYRLRFVPSEGL